MEWLGLIELAVVLAFVAGWGVLEVYALRLERKRRSRSNPERRG